jgi:PAS domain S-box-containing protein
VSEPAQVLVIDDEPHPRLLTVRVLEGAGYAVTEAASGEEGLRLARELRPDLILLDVVLPDHDGSQVCRRIKGDPGLAHIPVILLSGKRVDSDSMAGGLESGANGYILRGTPTREFPARVEVWLRIQRVERKLRKERHKLNDRVKELNCLFEISRLVERPGITLPEIVRGTTELLSAAWQHPEVACARIILDDQDYRTADYRADAPHTLKATIRTRGQPSGSVEVCYLESRPESDESLFLSEERDLLHAVAERLGRIVERHRAEEKLRASEETYRTLVEEINDVIYATDAEGVITYVSPVIEQLLGYPPSEIVGKPFAGFIAPADLERGTGSLERFLAGESGGLNEVRMRTASGEIRWVRASSRSSMTGDRVTGVRGVLTDITERKRAQAALQRSEERLQALLDMSFDLGTSSELAVLLNRALRHLYRVVDFERAGVMLADEEGVLYTHSFYAPDWPSGLATMQIPVARLPAFQAIFEQRQAAYYPDLQADQASLQAFSRVADEHWAAVITEMKTWLGTPLVVHDRAIGILSLLHSEPDRYDEAIRDLIQIFANQLAIAVENSRLYAQAQKAAALEERTRLARELHDSVTQSLYSITLHTDATLLGLEAGDVDFVEEQLHRLNQRARDAMTEMRLLIYQMRPSILEEAGLVAALNARLQSVEARSGMRTDLQVVGERRLPQEVESELFWIALEGLNNVIKHAQASQVSVQLAYGDGATTMVVQDDGVGFDPAPAARRRGGYGLATMEERVARVGGSLQIESAPKEGTTLRVEVKT